MCSRTRLHTVSSKDLFFKLPELGDIHQGEADIPSAGTFSWSCLIIPWRKIHSPDALSDLGKK